MSFKVNSYNSIKKEKKIILKIDIFKNYFIIYFIKNLE